MTNIFITKQTLSNTTMNNTHDDYKSLDNKIIIKSIGGGFSSKLNSRFINSSSYSSKPSKFKELAKIGGGCAHVCVNVSMMVRYNSRHLRLESCTNI